MNLETVTDQDTIAHDLPNQEPTASPTDQGLINHSLAQSPADQDPIDQSPPDQSMDEYLENGYGYEMPKRGDIRTGEIIEINDYGLVVDIGFKREGFVPAEDLTRLDEETRAEIQVGLKVSLFVLRPENREGHPILSIHQARMLKDWIQAEQMMASGEF
jgi:4-hydroxy-3-methylbut-2-enyl diphosphate reductase